MRRTILYDALIQAAASLASEGGENPEYDRGMAELIADSVGAERGKPLDERAAEVLEDIREHRRRFGGR